MNNLAVYGAGGLGREMALLVQQINEKSHQWNLLGFYDDYRTEVIIDNLPLLGDVGQLKLNSHPLAILVGIADCRIREKIVSLLANSEVQFPVFVHPDSRPGSQSNLLGRGTILTAGCILTTGIQVGEFVIINLLSTIGHDVKIGDYCSIMPSVNISGNVSIGKGVLIGSGATILQGLTVGDYAVIGAGAVVTRSVEAGTTVVGVPARKMKL